MFLRKQAGPLLVGFAAILWATDALFRLPAVQSLDATLIVLIEHVIVVLALLPAMFLPHRRAQLLDFTRRQWSALILIGAGGSALATVLFTESFELVNPSVAILLQKLQPVMVVLMAYQFLGERPSRKFYLWSSLALVSAAMLSFPEMGLTAALQSELDLKSVGALYALGAAGLWAAATVAGRSVAQKSDYLVITFWRFVFGLFALTIIYSFQEEAVPWNTLRDFQMARWLLYMAFVPGLAAMVAYYAGLKRTPASVATIAELLFPVSAVILNALVLDISLEPMQMLAGALLIFAVTMISI